MKEREAVEILLVEDNPADIELTLLVLQQHKLANSIHVVRDGEEALDYLFYRGAYSLRGNGTPRLVLLDLKLPKVSGLEVLAEMKKDARLRTIPVVVLTSSKEDRDLMESYQLGVNSYIQKPVDFDQFREVVGQVGMYWMVVNHTAPPAREGQA
jgi:CheY-like chemotaxis protein